MEPSPRTEAAAAIVALAALLRERGYAFVTPTPATHGRVDARPEAAVAQSLRDVFGWSRPFPAGLLPEAMTHLMERGGLLREARGGMRSALRFSTLDDLLLAHSSFPTTERDAVFFGPDTYKFVDALRAVLAAHTAAPRRAVDLCTGSGAAGLIVAARHPGCEVLLVDVNERALFLAGVNAAVAGLGNASPRRSDLFADVDGAFDLVTAHPPYLLDEDERTYRHGGGSFGEQLAIRIVEEALPRLTPGGTLLLFTGSAIVEGRDGLRERLEAILGAHGGVSWAYREVDPDVFGEELARPAYAAVERIALVVLVAARRETREDTRGERR